MLRVAGRFILDWNPTRQDVTPTQGSWGQGSWSSDFVQPYVADMKAAQGITQQGITQGSLASALGSAHMASLSLDGANLHESFAVQRATASALDTLVFAAAPAVHAAVENDSPVEPIALGHGLLMVHNAALSYGPSLVSSMVPHPEYAPIALTAPPRLMDDFQ